jgi:hypothetical protein
MPRRYFKSTGASVALCSDDRWLRMRCYDHAVPAGRPEEMADAVHAGRHLWRERW